MLKLVAPEVGGVKDSATARGTTPTRSSRAARRSSSTPSRSCPPKEGAALLATLPAARDFVADAAAHRKFIAYVEPAAAAAREGGRRRHLDEGFVPLKEAADCDGFVARCREAPLLGPAAAER